ncbi:lipopolysaccharide biosynthesis protein [Actinomyces viscosus]|uniref:Polysaccharide biosynthesis protein n=1 Tax=Actinomyces viscosus TaxID=1656 RepID=A0A448PL19_ACTVI|nr:lipopolysaccharide biosynthesis protein [Actinomyces viscosus]TFH53761.1 lipopolysaccharide biosynthesis protein [Actinomyces viscosus]VEI16093.1 Polysaccharide biosynthesis protein [Actinomyces viscosus]
MPRTEENKASQISRDYFWNTAASVMMSLATVVLLVVVTRTAGLAAAGVFGLAYKVGQQFQPLGMYEIRPYQVTDLQHRFGFGTYLATRIVTVGLMVLGIVGYALVFGKSPHHMLLIVLIASLRLFDAFEDVYVCEFQRVGRLDIGGQSWFWRSLVTTLAFCGMLVATGNLLVSTVVTLVISLLVTVVLYVPRARGLFPQRPVWEMRLIKELLVICLPLCLASFISMYLANVPTFAIDRYLDSTQQGYFQILFMPAMVINLLSLMVFRPLLTSMASLWVGANLPGFNRLIRRGLLVTAGAFVMVGTVTFLAGAPILGLVFGKDVSMFRAELMVLVLGGAMNAASVVLYYALTTMRLQKLVFAGYLVTAAAMTMLCAFLVPSYALLGVSIAYACGMTVLVLLFALFQQRAVAARSGEGHS